MKRFPVFAVVLALTALTAWSAAAAAADWQLVWSDEFAQPGAPDPTKWGFEEGLLRNQEAQYYTRNRPENARVEGGLLVLEGKKEAFADPAGNHAARYTSASLTTEGKASWTYGRIEVRAQLPTAKGVWPAIWTLGNNIRTIGWPRCGEIDLMEFVGNDPAAIHGTVHFSRDGHEASNGGTTLIRYPAVGFHVYTLEWTPDHLALFFDGVQYHRTPLTPAVLGPDNPFNQPHYLILNLALGGSWGGQIDDAALPQKFLIDYVRVYQDRALLMPATGH